LPLLRFIRLLRYFLQGVLFWRPIHMRPIPICFLHATDYFYKCKTKLFINEKSRKETERILTGFMPHVKAQSYEQSC